MILWHTGFQEIREPDVHHGRKNADFGQGFYLTADEEFAHRWAREQKGQPPIVNTYELDLAGLALHTFARDAEWFAYLSGNRRLAPDPLAADVILGPIANDTLYDTFGIITSGFLKPEDAMQLLMVGPEYRQIALKTEKAVKQLKWLGAETVTPEDASRYRSAVLAEQEEYQVLFAQVLEKIMLKG